MDNSHIQMSRVRTQQNRKAKFKSNCPHIHRFGIKHIVFSRWMLETNSKTLWALNVSVFNLMKSGLHS